VERLTATYAEWQAIVDAMPSLAHPSIRPAVIAGIAAQLAEQAGDRDDEPITLSLDDAGAVAVHRARHLLSANAGRTDAAVSAIAEAEAIIREHQRREE
jgi:hypothetical protein